MISTDLDRRRFLKLGLGTAAFAGFGLRSSTAFAYRIGMIGPANGQIRTLR